MERIADNMVREKAITRTSIIGICTNVFLAAFKAGAGLVAGSISIVLDAVNNLTDAFSSVITILGIKLAKKKPDENHPYGYGRIEYFSTILIALIVFAAGATSLVESVKKIFSPTLPEYTLVTVIIIVTSVITKLILGRYVKGQGEKYASDALVASGSDASFDAIISASTLVGAAVTFFLHVSVDGIIGAVISAFIVKAGFEMMVEAISHVIGKRPESAITGEIKQTVNAIPGVLGTYDLILHNYGPDSAIGSLHVEVDGKMTATELHALTQKVQRAVLEKFHIFVTVGIYAVDLENEEKVQMREKIVQVSKGHEGVLNCHGIFIDLEEKFLSFDVTMDFSIQDKQKMSETIKKEVEEIYPGFMINVNCDTNYSE
ncbi:MAG: cation diffusion facilitator family transporter [Acetatifactor sp.]|nr:cation diffusion facilitator family transporter [Acetatifactor sp.]